MSESSRPKLLGWGSTGIVYKLTNTIAVKRTNLNETEPTTNEYRIYDLLDKYPACPNIIPSFYRIPSTIFFQYMSGGTLDQRLRKHQSRDEHGIVVDVAQKEPAYLVYRWMAELIDATAWLESLGYTHGDLRPSNLLLDGEDHLKIADFDNTTTIGDVFDGLQPPYARVLGDEGGKDRGTFGYCGPRTEQFAIGSLIYYMTRGFEPYDGEWLGEDHEITVVERLQAMVFPQLSDGNVDMAIRNCWRGEYTSIQDLNTEVKHTCPDTSSDMAKAIDENAFRSAEQKCRQLVAEGVLDHAPSLLLGKKAQ
ncbi:MAG: hypothetical protein Q9188_002374, partial [Gyalolechia gomerana]